MEKLGIDQLTSALGWYGKMPSAGDFMQRRLEKLVVNWWDRWLSQGLIDIKQYYPIEVPRPYLYAPIWNFIIPANQGISYWQMGSLAPSRDRVGRLYPLVVSLPVATEFYEKQFIEGAARFYQFIGQALLQAVGRGCSVVQFEAALRPVYLSMSAMLTRASTLSATATSGDILSILNEGHGHPPTEMDIGEQLRWPELSSVFHPTVNQSFWWTNGVTGAAHQSFVFGGVPNSTLFETLFIRHQRLY